MLVEVEDSLLDRYASGETFRRALADAERKHILQTLRETDWVIGGQLPHNSQ